MNLTEQGMHHILWDSLEQYISLNIFSISISEQCEQMCPTDRCFTLC